MALMAFLNSNEGSCDCYDISSCLKVSNKIQSNSCFLSIFILISCLHSHVSLSSKFIHLFSVICLEINWPSHFGLLLFEYGETYITWLGFFFNAGQPFLLPTRDSVALLFELSLKKVCDAGDCELLAWLLLPEMYLLWLKPLFI